MKSSEDKMAKGALLEKDKTGKGEFVPRFMAELKAKNAAEHGRR